MSIERAIADMKRFSQGNLTQSVVFTNPDSSESATVRCLVSKHNLSIDPDTGLPVNSRNIHISVHESVLTDEGYTTRDAQDEIDLDGHRAAWADASGTTYTYLIKEIMPSNTFGLIVCILGEYNG